MVYLTLRRADNAYEMSSFELLERGWSEADVAAFNVVVLAAMFRFNVNVIGDETLPARRPITAAADLHAESHMTDIWEGCYFGLRGLGANASWVARILAEMPEGIPLPSMVYAWMHMPNDLETIQKNFEDGPDMPRADAEQLALWLKTHGLAPASMGRRLTQSQIAFTIFHLLKQIMAAGVLAETMGDMAAFSDTDLAHISYDFAKASTLHERFVARGRARTEDHSN